MEFEFRDGIPYVVGKPLSAREAFAKDRPLPDEVLRMLEWLDLVSERCPERPVDKPNP